MGSELFDASRRAAIRLRGYQTRPLEASMRRLHLIEKAEKSAFPRPCLIGDVEMSCSFCIDQPVYDCFETRWQHQDGHLRRALI